MVSKKVVYVLAALLLIAIGVAVYLGWNGATKFARSEAKREQERRELMTEREQLVKERDASLQAFADEERKNAVLVQLADKQRGQVNEAAHQISTIEGEQHDAAKQLVESQGSLSDDDITRKLCAELRALGYKSLARECPK